VYSRPWVHTLARLEDVLTGVSEAPEPAREIIDGAPSRPWCSGEILG
jgi:hypothetical protein